MAINSVNYETLSNLDGGGALLDTDLILIWRNTYPYSYSVTGLQINQKVTNPMLELGDMIYGVAEGEPARIAGNTTSNIQYLYSVGNGSGVATAPVWRSLLALNPIDGIVASVDTILAEIQEEIDAIVSVDTVGDFGSQASNPDGAVIADNAIFFQPATAANPGMIIVDNSTLVMDGNTASIQYVPVTIQPSPSINYYFTLAGGNTTTDYGLQLIDGVFVDANSNINAPGFISTTSAVFSNPTSEVISASVENSGGSAALQIADVIPSPINITTSYASLYFSGSVDTSSTLSVGAIISAGATETFSSSGNGTQLNFFTTKNGTTSPTAALTLDEDQSAFFVGGVIAPTFATPPEPITVVAGAGAIDCSSSCAFYTASPIVADTTFTLSNMSEGQIITFDVDSSGAFAVIFSPTLQWPNGLQPPATPSGSDTYTIKLANGIYRAAVLQAFA